MKRKKCRFCGSDTGCYRVNKRFTPTAIVISLLISGVGIIGLLELESFTPMAIILFMTSALSLVFITTSQYFCRSCGERRR
jgi:amino acid transporter